ncbi:hypothetical protein M011DRAFT_469830 [Sporormia fimetaria CBS 119925]|uniref:BTB domain-containing protein n=1 Tax=Sporormia fimetaria CBS 119925 TaxID=1340428 RepID=A0A6A6V5W9_9PLEO|nr:hypothetical protein M011DRAFT_469830 [Sporormia fimetaria CBS 119925]
MRVTLTASPTEFWVFVQWIYHGSYNLPSGVSHVDLWILGDKLEALKFKNYAMAKLLCQHASEGERRLLRPNHLDRAFEETSTESHLRKFMSDYLVSYYPDTDRFAGETSAWIEVFQKHGFAWTASLQLRNELPNEKKALKSQKEYFDKGK